MPTFTAPKSTTLPFHIFLHFKFLQLPGLIGGDFNTIIDPSLDRSTRNKRHWQSTDTIVQFMRDFGLGNGWRLQHPTDREYTYYSPVHHSYSRIDFVLTSNSIIPNISGYKIHPISISDHAPVTLIWNPTNLHKHSLKTQRLTVILKQSGHPS